ncbi:MAG: hypothetical protein IKR31_01735 [Prevotella sp.]|nr:hypothetical protein [Prevotella sp.]
MKKDIKQKRTYVRPAMRVHELRMTPRLLVGSGNGGLDPLSPFTPGGNPIP